MAQANKRWWAVSLLLAAVASGSSGCASLYAVSGLPARRLPSSLQPERQDDKLPIDLARLRQDPPPVYQLASGDILGIYIEGVLGDREQAPPVHFPQDGATPPAIGYPVPVREDGTIALPLVPPVKVDGLTLAQTEAEIRTAYTKTKEILREGSDRIIVTLMRPRTYRVLVIRQESGGPTTTGRQAVQLGTTKRGAGFAVDLQAYQNDVLHALTETGGMPGLDAKNEVIIVRGSFADAQERDQLLEKINTSDNPCTVVDVDRPDDPNRISIPLRYRIGDQPQFAQDDIILQSGDILLIESRDAELFYTGGLLGGGEYPLPRDRDLDVLGAIAMAGGPIAGSSGREASLFGNRNGLSGLIPPTEIVVVRTTRGGGQVPIKIDMNRALLSSSERILIQEGDLVILRYKPQELIANALLSTIQFNFIFDNLWRNRN